MTDDPAERASTVPAAESAIELRLVAIAEDVRSILLRLDAIEGALTQDAEREADAGPSVPPVPLGETQMSDSAADALFGRARRDR